MDRKFYLLTLIMFPSLVLAANSADFSAFKFYENVTPVVSVPTVVEVPFNQQSFSLPVFAVYNLTTNDFEPNSLVVEHQETSARVNARGSIGNPNFVNDGDYSTYLEFPVTAGSNKAELFFDFQQEITATSLSFTLDNYVALPQTISIRTSSSIRTIDDRVVLAPIHLTQGNVVFPKTTSEFWSVTFDYVQPLRISEIKFNDLSATTATRGLRFLAQPGQSYRIYFDADRYVQSTTKEAGDLFSSNGVVYSASVAPIPNPEYRPLDSDSDSIPDFSDNCTSVPNSDQKDSDQNGRGDACEDYDRDGVLNTNDNCRDIPNVAQTDTDKDGMGDICDTLDNRVTERMPWLPWVGIGVAGVVLLSLFVIALNHKKEDILHE